MAQDFQTGTTRGSRAAEAELRLADGSAEPLDDVAEDGGDDRVRRVGRRRAAGPARSRLAANDDSPSIGGLIYALNQKPSNKPFVVAAAGSAAWALVSILLGSALLAPDIARSAGFWDALARPAVLATVATVGVPIALFWFIAYLAWRAESLRLVSSAMTEVAVRLAEPDRLAEQSIASLGQSVRRQVAAMNDAISRAIGRAGELEALVHSEVAALERSYSENAHRIRSLIDELASERDALANNSDRVTDTLRGIGAEVSRDIAVASDEAARNLANAGARISDQLSSQSEQVADLLSEKGNSLFAALSVMNQRIASEVPVLLERLGGEQTRLTRIVEGAAKNLTALDVALAERVGELETSLGARTGELQSVIGERTEHLQSVLSAYTEAIDQRIAEHTQSFEESVGARTRSLGERLQQFEQSFSRTADALDRSLAETGEQMEQSILARSQALDAALIERTKAIDSAFSERLRVLEDGIADGANAIDQAVASRADMLRQAMQDHAAALSTTLTRQASDLDHTLVEGIDAVRRASETITSQSIQTIGGLSKQSQMLKDVSEGLLDQIHDLTRRFEMQNRSMAAVVSTIENAQGRLGTDIEARSRELERIRQETEATTERALDDIRSRFSTLSRGVAEQLDTLSNATRDVETRSQRLPDAVRSSSDTMRRAVQDQIRAIEAISGASRESHIQRDVSPGQGQTLPSLARSFEREMRSEPARQQPRAPAPEPSDRVPPSGRVRSHRQETHHAPVHGELGGLRETSWSLGDLLKRASLEDEDGAQAGIEGMMSPPAAEGSADETEPVVLANARVEAPAPPPRALSMEDMAQAIDAATAAEIWGRHRAGESGLFSRQIYSRIGQQTYDEIMRRLETDRGFRSMAERYLTDFERLLREADQRDPSGRMATAQIAGEMGRVYLLFGHATGRLT